VLFRHPSPAPTFGQLARERHDALRPTVKGRGASATTRSGTAG
jgi:hypothetical protein